MQNTLKGAGRGGGGFEDLFFKESAVFGKYWMLPWYSRLGPVFVHAADLRKNILNKVKKSSRIGQELETLITTSTEFFTTKVLFLDGKLGTRFYHHLIFTFS